jgi:hypothetical protein
MINVSKSQRDGTSAQTLKREVHNLLQLNSPFVVRYYTCFMRKKGKYFCIVMEIARGGTATKLIKVILRAPFRNNWTQSSRKRGQAELLRGCNIQDKDTKLSEDRIRLVIKQVRLLCCCGGFSFELIVNLLTLPGSHGGMSGIVSSSRKLLSPFSMVRFVILTGPGGHGLGTHSLSKDVAS